MSDTRNRDWHEMNADELRTEVRTWRARALQNRAELKSAQLEAENWQLKHEREHRNLMGLKLKFKDAERRATAAAEKLDELKAEHGPELVSFDETGHVYTGETTA